MGHFGDALRSERVSRGVSLEAISEKTKVVTRYLTALEDEQFEALPGGILSKGIVRGYVRALGLDEASWIERFMAASQERGLAPVDRNWAEFAENVSRGRVRNPVRDRLHLRWSVVAVLLILLAGLGWGVWRHINAHAANQDLQRQQMTVLSSLDQ